MKILLTIAITFFLFVFSVADAQYLSLSYPKYNSVIQRDNNSIATVTIAGQLVWGTGPNGSIVPGTNVSYKIKTLNVNPNIQGAIVNLTLESNGMFYTTVNLSKGWYLVEVMLNGAVYASSKVGVGDVFLIAGQSNAQGVVSNPGKPWLLPNTTGFPEWITGLNANQNCYRGLPETINGMYSLTDPGSQYNSLGPTGNNVWCYAVLGKKISDANGGMPVAFFNTASGGSTVTQWYNGAQGLPTANPYTGGQQFCIGYPGASPNPTDYYGQPYTPLKFGLNYYASIFGVGAILWHQGEADSDNTIPANYKATSSADYQNKLQFVIDKSRTDFGANVNPNILTWIISKATISKFGPLNNTIRTGQGNVVNALNKVGPDTDYAVGSVGTTTAITHRRDSTHFEESKNNALTWLAGKWFDAIGNNGNRIPAGFVPQLSYAVNGSKRILTAPAGYLEYRWGYSINSPIAGATTNVFTTETCYPEIKCFLKDAKGNWHVSAATWVHCYTSNIVAGGGEVEKNVTDEPALNFTTYPNPYQEEFLIEFNVSEDGSDVQLELVDVEGRILKTIVSNPHARGKWKYYSGKMEAGVQQVLCRLKVNNLYTVKKLVKAE
ncbi:sialate O-acetylesterase [Dyadobacter sandarakinus]|uniref:Sialate O-acetylesterase domain-containing protein n=1 Tax=Dyadobacter sandarakinus TaxID=2747268 RepID=A0ABX7ICB6_9BACT|nr:sialate O-acetylesterase [Dyadobacter sandarakinus]QRR03460.1 hypothetical protein HWI92_22370 [Dyadobacter sandarakinus]